jgi:hypothetical protein
MDGVYKLRVVYLYIAFDCIKNGVYANKNVVCKVSTGTPMFLNRSTYILNCLRIFRGYHICPSSPTQMPCIQIHQSLRLDIAAFALWAFLNGVSIHSLLPFPAFFPFAHKSFPRHHICLVPPSTSPCTFVQSIVPSNSSSSLPTTATLSPRTIYKPSGTSSLATSSSRGRMMRSMADWRTRFMEPSHECKVPIMVRPSRVNTVTRSGVGLVSV